MLVVDNEGFAVGDVVVSPSSDGAWPVSDVPGCFPHDNACLFLSQIAGRPCRWSPSDTDVVVRSSMKSRMVVELLYLRTFFFASPPFPCLVS